MNWRGFYFTLGVGTIACWILMGQLDRSNFGSMLVLYTLIFAITLYHIQLVNDSRWLFIPLVTFHGIAFYYAPHFSDDYWRFLWDGHLTTKGISPYQFTPVQVLINGQTDTWLREIYPHLNSPHYYSVYPPLNQLMFSLAGWAKSPEQGLAILKILVLVGNALLFLALELIRKTTTLPKHTTWLILLNPLLIVETTGNLHFEGFTIALFLLGFYLIQQHKSILSSLLFACAVSVKLIPLLFLPFVYQHFGWKKNSGGILVFIGLSAILALPLINLSLLQNMLQSLDLYFRNFEFNASFYSLLNKPTSFITGYNTIQYIGPFCSLVFLGLFVYLWVKHKPDNTSQIWRVLTLVILGFYFCSTTVHPWYILYPMVLGVLAGNRMGLYFSLLVILSYGFYLYGESRITYALTFVEYGLLALIYFNRKKDVLVHFLPEVFPTNK